MSDTVPIEARLRRLDRLPYGTARTAAAESIAREIDASGPASLQPEALLALVEAYTFDGHADRAIVPFAKALRLWDASPELFDEIDTRTLFWSFKWIAAAPAAHPQISATQAEALIDDMERRYRLAGLSLAAVEKIRFSWLWHRGHDFEEARRRWESAIGDGSQDCTACDTATRVALSLERGELDEAVQMARAETTRCNREPAGMLFDVAIAHVRRGDRAAALTALAEARREMEGESTEPYAQWRGQEFEVLARVGELDTALGRLAREAGDALLVGDSPRDRFELLRGVVAGLAAHRARFADAMPRMPAGLGGITTVGDLHDWARAEAATIAAAFDQRNGTTRFTDSLAMADSESPILAAAPEAPAADGAAAADHPGAEDSAPVEPRRVSADEHPAPGDLAAPSVSPPEAADPVELWRRAEALPAGDPAAPHAYALAAEAAESAGLLDDAGLAWAESGQAARALEQIEAADEALSRGVRLLAAGEAPLDVRGAVIEAWAPVAVQAGRADRALAALLDELAALDDQEHRAGKLGRAGAEAAAPGAGDGVSITARAHAIHSARCEDSVARIVAAGGKIPADSGSVPQISLDEAAGRAVRAAELFEESGMLLDAAQSAWLAASLQARLRRTQEAVMTYEAVLAALRALRRRDLRARAAGELIELHQAVGDAVAAEAVARSLTD